VTGVNIDGAGPAAMAFKILNLVARKAGSHSK
jgi:hypothetical protein